MKVSEGRQIFSVTELNTLAGKILNEVTLWVEGEVFELKYKERQYRYAYFYLKDPETEYQLPCIAEPKFVVSSDSPLKEGENVIAYGNLGLFEKSGKYQFYASRIEPFGEGEILKKLKQLKEKLDKEGLFSDSHKKEIPEYPIKIGVITSAVGAAWQDFRKQSVDRFPFLEITLKDVLVQGQSAPEDICKAIAKLDNLGLDVLVVTRGGGSLEDLMAFNTESVARAIFSCKTPIVCAVGHEVDVTIADLVADMRASTPTNAAEILVRNYHTFFGRVEELQSRLMHKAQALLRSRFEILDNQRYKLSKLTLRFENLPEKLKNIYQLLSLSQKSLVTDRYKQMHEFVKSMESQSTKLIDRESLKLKTLLEKLNILSPKSTLKRGYAVAYNLDGKVIKDIKNADIGDLVKVQLYNGALISQVKEKK
jgi:exodeoxyribonuclease VII large subunit